MHVSMYVCMYVCLYVCIYACHVIHHDDAVCAAVIGRGDGAETLLWFV